MYLVMEIEIKNWLTQIKKGYLDLCILALIESQEKTYGFQLISSLGEHGITVKEGTLYPLLNRMTKDGLLQARWETEDIQGHPRKFYSLTQTGRNNLKAMRTEYESMYVTFEDINTVGGKNGKSRA